MERAEEGPRIGIPTGQLVKNAIPRVAVPRTYVRAVEGAGGLPLLLPLTADPELIGPMLDAVDGLLLAGGGDVDPQLYGEEPLPGLGQVDPERDLFEVALVKEALRRDLPVLGLCRGAQVINVAAGGTLYQDIPSQVQRALQHDQQAPRWHPTHEVRLEEETTLARIFNCPSLRVNSFHHQSVKMVTPDFRVSAKARDAVVEGIESREHRFVVGVQWHPECMVERFPVQRLLFSALVQAARDRVRGRAAGRAPVTAVAAGGGATR